LWRIGYYAGMNAISVPMDAETEEALDKIAAATKRPRQDIAAEAIAAFVREEAETIESILQAQADLRAGKGFSHEDVMARARKIIAGE